MKECPACRRCFPDDINHCPNDGEVTSSTLLGEPVLDGRYSLERRLGQGGMGIVFQARHIFLKTSHAIKVILPDLVGNDPMLVTRFRQEALAAAAIRHQNIVAVTDFGVVRGTMPFLVMEYIDGLSLQDLIAREGRLPWPRALELTQPIADGLSAAHKQGIIHRDLKPLNIIIKKGMSAREGLRILDFGLAKIKSGELLGSFIQAQTSGLMGSPFYMAPEQWSDEEPDARADIYSLGVILYQMLAGDVPFKGSSIPSIMRKHLTERPPSFESLGIQVPTKIEGAVMRALEKNSADRFSSVDDFKQALLDAARDGSSDPTTLNSEVPASEPIEEFGYTTQQPPVPNVESIINSSSEAESLVNSLSPDPRASTSLTLDEDPSTVALGSLTLHMHKQQKTAPEEFSATIALKHKEAFRHSEEHVFEELVLHKDYERLWRSLIHASGCNLLTGYGPFGGTSLVRCAISKAREELQKSVQGHAALLVFYFEVLREDKQSFELKATKFGLDHLNRSGTFQRDSGFEELRARAGQAKKDQESLLSFSLENPLGQTFFNPRQASVVQDQAYDFTNLVEDLNAYFRERSSSKVLRQIVANLVRSEFLPSCVVFIIDRVRYLETIEALAASDFFSNKRIRVIVVSRKEDLDAWNDADNRLETINFSKWYVPGLWNIDFDRVLFDIGARGSLASRDDWKTFLRHLQFVGRGSLGNILKELKHGRNVNFGERTNFIDVESLSGRHDIQHNAWLQELLEMNWDMLLCDQFVGVDHEEKTDRARIAIYYLLDWLSRKDRFTKEEIIEQSLKTRITISDVAEIRIEIVEALLHLLLETQYLIQKRTHYKISWRNDRPHRKVARVKRTGELPSGFVGAPPPPRGDASAINTAYVDAKWPPIRERLAKVLRLFVHFPTPSTPLKPAEHTQPVLSHLPKPPDSSHKQVDPPTVVKGAPPRQVLKSVHKKIIEKRTYFIEDEKVREGSLGMLIVFANPKGSDPLRLGEEDRIIRECIKRCKYRESFREKIVHAARIRDVQRELVESDYQIVQFSGHGTPAGELAFEDETGQLKLVSQKALANLLLEFPSIQCVVLNACYSKNQGEMISLGVPFTIAMDKAISDDASQSFTRGFYDALGAGKDYSFAYRMGCQAISLDGYAEESTPVLLERPQLS